jgi:hypothetical protein
LRLAALSSALHRAQGQEEVFRLQRGAAQLLPQGAPGQIVGEGFAGPMHSSMPVNGGSATSVLITGRSHGSGR